MKKKLLLIPTIIKRRNSLSVVVDINLIKFLKMIFKNFDIQITSDLTVSKFDCVVSAGGNTVFQKRKNASNLYRSKLDKYYLTRSIKMKIPFLGICHGAHSVANYFNLKITKKSSHVRQNHLLNFHTKKYKNTIVNSYHNYSVTSLNESFKKLAWTTDGSIEAFTHNKMRILCIMWHPERNKKFKVFDKNFIKEYL